MVEHEIDKFPETLDAIAQNFDPKGEEYKALKLAIKALHFVGGTRQWDFFKEYLDTADEDAPRRAHRAFSSMADAESWLQQQSPSAVLGTVIKVGQVAYYIERDPSKMMLVRTVELDALDRPQG